MSWQIQGYIYPNPPVGTGVLEFTDRDKIAWTISSGMKLDITKGCREGELQGGYSSTILNSAQALARRAHTMEGMRKGKNAMVALSPICNRGTAIENGGTSLYRGNPE